ncbi:MAG: BadF/BadG/BcrA/BcrD ATPase family protein [Candidatus Nanopelagicales bacterium]
MKTLLAVDGGNSKTDVVLADELGHVLSRVRGEGCSPDALEPTGSLGVLLPLIANARSIAGLADDHTFNAAAFFLAGVDRPEQESLMVELLQPLALADELIVANDTFAVLQAGSANGWGVAVVCGAGLNAVGVTPEGRVGRYQALGELSGDWGGGFSVGLSALGAAIRGDDGRGPVTVLTPRISEHFHATGPQEIAAAIHEQRLDAQVLVDCAPLVFACAAEGDEVSRQIVDRVGDEVAVMAVAMLRRIALDNCQAEVVLGGGLMQSGYQPLVSRTEQLIHDRDPSVVVRVLDVPPVIGCVRETLRMCSLTSADIESALVRLAKELAGSESARDSRVSASPVRLRR